LRRCLLYKKCKYQLSSEMLDVYNMVLEGVWKLVMCGSDYICVQTPAGGMNSDCQDRGSLSGNFSME
jgi:hypothetical protein